MWSRSLLVLVGVAATLSGCSDRPAPEIVRPAEVATTPPVYDPELEPSAAVLAVVPTGATLLEVTDYDQIRYSLGFGELSSESDPATLSRFWTVAERTAPLLGEGLLRAAADPSLGFTQDDVAWEAHFSGPSGAGYVVVFRDDLDMGLVQRAAATTDGPLAGAVVAPDAHLVALGATRMPTESWAAEPELVELVGARAGSTYVTRDCVEGEEAFGTNVVDELAPTPAADLESLEELGAFSVAFSGELVTARLGAGRPDVFTRARLADTLPATDPEFGLGFSDPVGDPAGGRIGFRLGEAPVAVRLVQERQLPFAVCGDR